MIRGLLVVALGMALGAPVASWAQGCLQPPASCRVSSPFGPRLNPHTNKTTTQFHNGVDYACPIGTPVKAASDGVAAISGFSQTAGNWIVSQTAGGQTLKYMHNSQLLVRQGLGMKAGQQIAFSGNTGAGTGPHLHFQAEVAGVPRNPDTLMCGGVPPSAPGILDGDTPPTDLNLKVEADVPPQMTPDPSQGYDAGFRTLLGDVIASRALNPDYARQLATLEKERLYSELAYMEMLSARTRYEKMLGAQRIEGIKAAIISLLADQTLMPELRQRRQQVQSGNAPR